MELVTVVIPFYKKELSLLEQKALIQVNKVLSNYTITIIKPETLNLNHLLDEFPNFRFESFDDSFFRSIASYNRLMLSPVFYERFLNYNYILIYQLDAYVFKDDLLNWCNKEYDYIGAPWPPKSIYRMFFLKHLGSFIRWYKELNNKRSKQSLYYKIGNGGFSLRKVESHYKAAINYQDKINYYLEQPPSHFYNEDVFWATEIPEFIYPSSDEAVKFSFDKYPRYCLTINRGQLPFGCHAWYKKKNMKFWKPIIGF